MKNISRRYLLHTREILSLLILILSPLALLAQTPQGLPKPHENDPIDLSSPFSIIYFIIIPLIAAITYFLLKRRKNRKENNKE